MKIFDQKNTKFMRLRDLRYAIYDLRAQGAGDGVGVSGCSRAGEVPSCLRSVDRWMVKPGHPSEPAGPPYPVAGQTESNQLGTVSRIQSSEMAAGETPALLWRRVKVSQTESNRVKANQGRPMKILKARKRMRKTKRKSQADEVYSMIINELW